MIPDVLKLKFIWHDVNPGLGQRLYDRLKTVPGGPIPLMYLDGRLATKPQADSVRAGVGHVGIYLDPHWYPGDGIHKDLNGASLPDPVAFRRIATAKVASTLVIGDPVMFDFEKVPVSWLREFLWGRLTDGIVKEAGWRGTGGQRTGGSNPSRPTGWTDASYQAGNWAAAIPDLITAGFVLYVQLYYGNMAPVEEPLWALLEPVFAGYPVEYAKPFYDAAHYPTGWHARLGGGLFTTQRLPWLFTLHRRLAMRIRHRLRR